MFRFFSVLGFSFYGALIFANLVPFSCMNLLIILSGILVLACIFTKKIRQIRIFTIISGAIFLAFSGYTLNYYTRIKPVDDLGEGEFRVTGEIVELVEYRQEYDYYRYVFRVDHIDDNDTPKNFKIILSSSSPIEADIYDTVTANVHISHFDESSEFSQKDYYKSRGIYASGYFYTYKPIDVIPCQGVRGPYYYALKAREKLISSVNVLFDTRQASVVNGILLGDKFGLQHDIKRDFDRCGIYHLLAVSGMHVAMLSGILVQFLKKTWVNRKISYLVAILFLVVFMALTGLTPSVLRAGIMMILYFLGLLFSQNADSLNSLGLSILLITAFDVNLASSIGLLMSFLSVLGILSLVPRLEKYAYKKFFKFLKTSVVIEYIADVVLTSLSVYAFTLPVSLLYYKKFSLVGIISNVLLLYPVTLMLGFCVLLLVLYVASFPNFVLVPLKLFCGLLINYVLRCTNWLSSFPLALVSTDYLFVKIWVIGSLFTFGIAFLFKDLKKSLKIAGISSLILIVLSGSVYAIFIKDTVSLAVLNSENNPSFVCSKFGKNALIVCRFPKKNKNYIFDSLENMNIFDLDTVILLSYVKEDIATIQEIINRYDPKQVLLKELPNMKIKKSEDGNILSFTNNFRVKLGGNVSISGIWQEENVALSLDIYDKKVLICPDGGNFDKSLFPNENYDILILGGLLNNIEFLNPNHILLTMNKRDFKIVEDKLHLDGCSIVPAFHFKVPYVYINEHGYTGVGRKI